eukprot:CAMPEP_0168795632 /NCGR_PEP_ID=MMETSP0725-20121227/16304_1 /TAXON_ID=265536 /ORGANISM="Amphiprora sp., Strain CCMP467" /LENGTH=62 /DNA_ID=CAMNT_0008846651 /DNA_START=29 /DNA_END=214 /DNA_ORIENTATION=-
MDTTTTAQPEWVPPTIPPENIQAIQGLQPASFGVIFAAISSIPRASGHEAAILRYLRTVATA